MGRKTATFALTGALWLSAGIGACCSDESAPQGADAEAAQAPEGAVKDGEAAVKGAGAEAPGDDGEGPGQGEPGEAPLEVEDGRKPGDDQLAVDKLFELKAEDVDSKLEEAGWKTIKPGGEEIKNGRRFEVTKGKSKARVELVEFDTPKAADTYMFAVEKVDEARLGRINNKLLAIFPSQKGDKEATAELMQALMPAPAAAQADEDPRARPEGEEVEGKPRDTDVGGELPFKGEDPSGGKPLEEPAPELEPTKVEEMPPARKEPAKEVEGGE